MIFRRIPRLGLFHGQDAARADFEPAVVDEIANELGDNYGLLIRVLGILGLRWGEAAALRRRHVDLLRKRLRVEASIAELGGKLIEGSTKSHAVRSVPLSPGLGAALEKHLQERVAPRPTPICSQLRRAGRCGTPTSTSGYGCQSSIASGLLGWGSTC